MIEDNTTMIVFIGFIAGIILGICVFADINAVVIDKQVVHEVCQELTGNESAYYEETAGIDWTFVCVVPDATIEILDEGLVIIERR